MSTPATARLCCRVRRSHALPRNNFQDTRGYLVGEVGSPDSELALRPARPAAGDPARRRLRAQPRAVHRRHRGNSLPARHGRPARAEDGGRLADRVERHRRFQPRRDWWAGRVPRPASAREGHGGRQHRHRHRAGRAVADRGEIISPAVGFENDGKNYHNNFQDPEAFLLAGAGVASSTCP